MLRILFLSISILIYQGFCTQVNQSEIASKWKDGTYTRYYKDGEAKEVSLTFLRNKDEKVNAILLDKYSLMPDLPYAEHFRFFESIKNSYTGSISLYFIDDYIVVFNAMNEESMIKILGTIGKQVKNWDKLEDKIRSNLEAGKLMQKKERENKSDYTIQEELSEVKFEIITENNVPLTSGVGFEVGFVAITKSGKTIKSANLGGTEYMEDVAIEIDVDQNFFDPIINPQTGAKKFTLPPCEEMPKKQITVSIVNKYSRYSIGVYPTTIKIECEKSEGPEYALFHNWSSYSNIRYINNKGKLIVIYANNLELNYERDKFRKSLSIMESENQCNIAFVEKDGMYGVVQISDLKEITPFIYSEIHYSLYGKYIRAKKDGKYGFLDCSGKEVLEFAFKSVYDVKKVSNQEYFICEFNGSFVFYGIDFQSLSTLRFDSFHIDPSGGMIGVKKDGKWGFLNDKFELQIPFLYESVKGFNNYSYFSNSYYSGLIAAVKLNDKWGIIDSQGKLIIPAKYEVAYLNYEYNNKNGRRFEYAILTDPSGEHPNQWLYVNSVNVSDEADYWSDWSPQELLGDNNAMSNNSSNQSSGNNNNSGTTSASKTTVTSTSSSSSSSASKESGFSGSVNVVNDTGKELHYTLTTGGGGWWSSGSSKTVKCQEGQIVYVSTTNKSSDKKEVFKVTKEMCGKTIKLSKYYK